MQSDAGALVSFFIVQDPRLTFARSLGRRCYKYVFRIHINGRIPNQGSHV
jgi:hypothetical protein